LDELKKNCLSDNFHLLIIKKRGTGETFFVAGDENENF
jgi:hypothetical protein